MSALVGWLGNLLLFVGAFLCLSGALGLLRFPDFYSRAHAAGVTDTLGTALIIVGLMLQPAAGLLVSAKLLCILAFFFFTIPTSSHVLAMAALYGGLKPLLGEQSQRSGE